MEKIILIGGGGHCKVVIDSILQGKFFNIIGILDKYKEPGIKVLNIKILGKENLLEKYFKDGIRNTFITLGSVGEPSLRIKLYRDAKKAGYKIPNIINLTANFSKYAVLNEGNYIGPLSSVNAGVNIGSNCILNTGVNIDHDCCIGNFVHIAPGVSISGGVKIGDNTHIGTGSSIKHAMKIGRNTIIGVGSVVVKDIPDSVIAYGNPCKIMGVNDGKDIYNS